LAERGKAKATRGRNGQAFKETKMIKIDSNAGLCDPAFGGRSNPSRQMKDFLVLKNISQK